MENKTSQECTYDHDNYANCYIAVNKDDSSSSSTDVTLEATSAANSESNEVSGCNFNYVILWLPYYKSC